MKVIADVSDQDIYNFNSSEIGDSWLIGTDKTDDANAFKNGVNDCPENLTIPSSLTYKAETKPVEVIGQYAFNKCASRGKTKRLTITKQLKVIKEFGLGRMDNLEYFELEDGSVLEIIEEHGLDNIGGKIKIDDEDMRVTLTLPSTLSSVYENGIFFCNIFNVIIYCGSHPLNNPSSLVPDHFDMGLKVSSQYPPNVDFFKHTPERDTPDVVEKCSLMEDRPSFISVPIEGGCEVTGWGNSTGKWCPLKLEIPEIINGSNVISINESAFANCDTEGPISLPSTLQRVGASAFANTSFVTAVIATSSELNVGESAFEGCGKEALLPINVSLPENIQLNNRAFAGAKIGEVYVMPM